MKSYVNCSTKLWVFRGDRVLCISVFLFISDVAPYILKAGQALSVVYSKMTHFTSVAHLFHRAAEMVRGNYPEVDLLIS